MEEAVFQQRGVAGPRWLHCEGLDSVIEAHRPEDVAPALSAVRAAADRGLYAAGFMSYEAAGGLDPALVTCAGVAVPLVWFGLFRRMVERSEPDPRASADFSIGKWQAQVGEDEYRRAVESIRSLIAAGDTYQVNYTFPMHASFAGEPWALFARLCSAQRAEYCGYIDTGRHVVCSASPELFFELSDGVLTSRPMKGTAPRGLTLGQDRASAQALAGSIKDRAENAMIVDMMRNDIGRIAAAGSVSVGDVFRIEKYPTLYQMTTKVSGRTAAPLDQIMASLFPAASITGTPKVRAMQIICELEHRPRGVYTGCVGYVAPGGRARFNVAIRTVVMDRQTGSAEYGVGGGIVWDSQPEREWAECQTKTAVLSAEPEAFELLETMRWDRDDGFYLLEGHLRRLAESAEYFGFPVDMDAVRRRLTEWSEGTAPARPATLVSPPAFSRAGTVPLAAPAQGDSPGCGETTPAKQPSRPQPGQSPTEAYRIRLRLADTGRIMLDHGPLAALPTPYRLRLAQRPINSHDPFLYHKTPRRRTYDSARAAVADCDDVVLFNERGEITETTIANVVVRLDGRLVTPPVECGLLPGVFRAQLLARGEVTEQVITVADLWRGSELFAVNSVRQWMRATLVA